MKERFANLATSGLSATITSTDTSLTVDDGSRFPASGNFRLRVDDELLVATARSGNVLTVVRGIEGTTAAGHVAAATVTQIITVGGMDRWLRDSVPGAGSDSSRPPFALLDASGNTLDSSDFTTVNLSDSVVTDQDGTICLRMLAGGASIKVTALARTAPATPNALIVGLQFVYPTSSSGRWVHSLVGFRESASGKMLAVNLYNDSANGGLVLAVNRYDSPTTLNSTVLAKTTFAMTGDVVWFKAVDDGSSLKLFIGDGWEFIQVYTEARTAFMTGGPDEYIAGANCGGNGFDSITRLVAWEG